MILIQIQTVTKCELWKVPVWYRPNAASGGWSYGVPCVMMTYEGDTPLYILTNRIMHTKPELRC